MPAPFPGRGTLARMAEIHPWLGLAAIVVCALAAVVGGALYRRRGTPGRVAAHLLALAQTVVVAQVAVGLLVLASGRRSPHELHYLYGSLSLAAVLTPWFYAPADSRRRLAWFAGTSAVAAALAIRAFTTGS